MTFSKDNYRKTFNISSISAGIKIVDLSDAVGASPAGVAPCRRCSNYIFILDLTPGFNGLGKYNCETNSFDSNFTEVCSKWSNEQYVKIDLRTGFYAERATMPNERQCRTTDIKVTSSAGHWWKSYYTQILSKDEKIPKFARFSPIVLWIFFYKKHIVIRLRKGSKQH